MESLIWGMVKTWLHVFLGIGFFGSLLLIVVKIVRWIEERE